MAIKIVKITADKGGTLARQEEQMAKAEAELQALLIKATRTVSVISKEDDAKFQFIAVVELPEETKAERPTSRKEK